jgi:hypothetical protein
MIARKLLDNHRLAHAARADNQQIGHAGARRKGDEVAELVERLTGARIIDPAIDPDAANALLGAERGDLPACREQMREAVSHPIPPPENKAAPAAGPARAKPRVRWLARPETDAWLARDASPSSFAPLRRRGRAERKWSRR